MPFNIPVKAGGDINPSRFVTGSGANTVVQSGAGDTKVLGVSTEATKNAPQTGGSTLAAESGDQLRIYHCGEDCLLELGTGGCTAWDFLKSDSSGKGVTASSTNTAHALALETASAGEKAHVLLIGPTYVA